MIYKLGMSVYKEFLLLKRDFGGLVTLFVMPLVLVIAVTLIQDSTFVSGSNAKIPILLVDNDKGKVSKKVYDNLQKSDIFTVVTKIDTKPLTESLAKEAVFKGKYQLAIIIPEKLSSDLQLKINQNVEKITSSLGLTPPSGVGGLINQKEVKLYFDPAVQMSFKNAVMSSVDKMISQIETKSIYTAFQEQLGDENASFEQKSFITFKEIVPRVNDEDIIPNSVQHNVPAWTLFAMFFIVLPLSINIVKEKTQGTFVRLRTNPVSNSIVLAGKTIMYLIICMIQFYDDYGCHFLVSPFRIALAQCSGSFVYDEYCGAILWICSYWIWNIIGNNCQNARTICPFWCYISYYSRGNRGCLGSCFCNVKSDANYSTIITNELGIECFLRCAITQRNNYRHSTRNRFIIFVFYNHNNYRFIL